VTSKLRRKARSNKVGLSQYPSLAVGIDSIHLSQRSHSGDLELKSRARDSDRGFLVPGRLDSTYLTYLMDVIDELG